MNELRGFIRDLLLPLMVALSLALVIQEAVAKPYEIPTGSMIPTIQKRDRVIANRIVYRFREPNRGDVIVFQPTTAARQSCPPVVPGVPFVKRVIGIPGDRVEVRGGETLVNGTPLDVKNARVPGYDFPAIRVPKGRLFVLGDNRNESCDSHLWQGDSFVHRGAIIGQAEVTYWPLRSIKFLR